MILVIVQARMGSTRLPGKVMEKIEGQPMIGLLLERLKHAKSIDQIVVATTTETEDDKLAAYVQSLGLLVYRGSKDDVVDRFYQCAKKYEADHIGRVTGDCPLIDPQIVDQAIDKYLKSGVDYLSNDFQKTSFPDGLDFEIFKFGVLETVWNESSLRSDREHVSPFILRFEKFKKMNFACSQDLSSERWTVDEPKDLEKIRQVFKNLYMHNRYFSMWDILSFLKKHPEINSLNQNIQRNEGYQISLKEESRAS